VLGSKDTTNDTTGPLKGIEKDTAIRAKEATLLSQPCRWHFVLAVTVAVRCFLHCRCAVVCRATWCPWTSQQQPWT
jgi:hypothetical protein